MAIFASFGRRGPGSAGEAPGRELSKGLRQSLPPRFEAVGEALVSAADTCPACAEAGRGAASDGAGLGEALEALRTTFDMVLGREPDFSSVEALSVAWSEATLEFLHEVSCEDPLTGMATLPHLRSRVAELYREADHSGGQVAGSHALVVVEMTRPHRRRVDNQLTRALQLAQVSAMMRAVFAGGETIARLSTDRAVVVVRRTRGLGDSVAMMRGLLGDLDLGATKIRVWIEGLPPRARSVPLLLDELSR